MNTWGLMPPNKGRAWVTSMGFSVQVFVCDNSRMEITQQCVVALTWTLKDSLGEELDVLDAPVEFLVGGGDLFEVIETALQGHTVGATLNLNIEPEQGFGEFNDQLIFLEPRELFPPELEEGMTFEGAALPAGCTPGMPQDALYTVTDIYPEHVVLDGNHPLAGIALRLKARVEAVRPATELEISLGSLGTGFFKLESLTPGKDMLH
jgi:FKBP-type peptidyl-prolyl cis-trans isomerase SlyD